MDSLSHFGDQATNQILEFDDKDCRLARLDNLLSQKSARPNEPIFLKPVPNTNPVNRVQMEKSNKRLKFERSTPVGIQEFVEPSGQFIQTGLSLGMYEGKAKDLPISTPIQVPQPYEADSIPFFDSPSSPSSSFSSTSTSTSTSTLGTPGPEYRCYYSDSDDDDDVIIIDRTFDLPSRRYKPLPKTRPTKSSVLPSQPST